MALRPIDLRATGLLTVGVPEKVGETKGGNKVSPEPESGWMNCGASVMTFFFFYRFHGVRLDFLAVYHSRFGRASSRKFVILQISPS
ncbi:hypothetical protein CEXT_82531 [Caerostris extrusa]|uniref:Uncharacterized protein n=1 Tax=Caerostris extrusa TaxID=172846 RepID=A0AAV4YCB4_CAEEX|nr:hypothetical protein CEXT_82531 [Caerostris extrusa]